MRHHEESALERIYGDRDVQATLFDMWLRQVGANCRLIGNMSRDDLDDMPWATWFENGVSAKAAARRAIKWTMKGYRPDFAD